MPNYKLSNEAKDDLIRVHRFGVLKFGEVQADKYFNTLFDYFDIIAESPFSFPSVNFIKQGYRRCVCGVGSIYYRVDTNGVVEIMAIVGRQDLKDIVT